MGGITSHFLLQATATFITEERMMINGFLTLSVVVVCAVYLLGGVVGDADTVPQEWPGRQSSCHSCFECESALAMEKEWGICEFILRYDLEKLVVDALEYCPAVVGDFETLIETALICKFSPFE